jgi:L-asparaginase II
MTATRMSITQMRTTRTRAYAGGVLLAQVVRSGFAESWHRGSIAVVDASGALTSSAGDPYGPIFPRSSNKPMQAVAMLRAGLTLADPADVAMVAASHSGEAPHVTRVRALLAAGGLTEADLRCPEALPLDEAASWALLRAGGDRGRLYMNCSGKHAGMLRTCQAAGWPLENYLAADHPLQRACRSAIEELAGEHVTAVGVDGCGAPVMAISLVGLARAFARAVAARSDAPERAVADAMRAHPYLVSGTEREDLTLMEGVPGLLSKVGAEGVMAVAMPDVGAVALKIDDGGARARMPVLVAVLRQLGLAGAPLDDLAETPVHGGDGVVGSVTFLAPAPAKTG